MTRTKTNFIRDENDWLLATRRISPCQEIFEAHQRLVISVNRKPNKINSFSAFSLPGGLWLQLTIDG